jgi:hypothetical protein
VHRNLLEVEPAWGNSPSATVNQILHAAGIPNRVIFTGNWYNSCEL